MNRFHRYATCAVLALVAALPTAAQNIDAKEYWLDNGMQVLMVERHEAPTIMASIFARVGSANETSGITGISHLFEHMMFKGTDTIGTKDIERDREIIARLDELRAELRAEERIMREQGYFEYEEHKADHEELLDDIREIMENYEMGAYLDYEDTLAAHLNDWFTNHFKTKDARLHAYLD